MTKALNMTLDKNSQLLLTSLTEISGNTHIYIYEEQVNALHS